MLSSQSLWLVCIYHKTNITQCKVGFTPLLGIAAGLEIPVAPDARAQLNQNHHRKSDDQERVNRVAVALSDNAKREQCGSGQEGVTSRESPVEAVSFVLGLFSQNKTGKEAEEDQRHQERPHHHHVRHPEVKRIKQQDRDHDQTGGDQCFFDIIYHK